MPTRWKYLVAAAFFLIPLAAQTRLRPEPQISFEPNVGQSSEIVDYLARARGYAVTLRNGSYSLGLRSAPHTPKWMLPAWKRFAPAPEVPWIVSMHLVSSNEDPKPVNLEPSLSRSHYLRGRDPENWIRNVQHYGRIRYEAVYPGIDIEYYGRAGAMEFDLIVGAEADPHQIRMKFEGTQEIELDAEGDLVLRLGERELRQRRPVVYQRLNGKTVSVTGRYVLANDKTVTFSLASYDSSRPVIIDPLIEWEETVGGGGDDFFNALFAGPDGTIHAVGTTESTDIPTRNAWSNTNQGGPSDAYVARFSPGGSLISATFLGGDGRDQGNDIVVDPDGVIYIFGTTNSSNFPVSDGAFQPNFGGAADAFVTILSPDGSSIIGSTFLGGPGVDLGLGIALDDQGREVIVTGGTFGSGFPVTPGAFQTDPGGDADAFVTRMSPDGSSVRVSTFFGGEGRDIGQQIIIPGGDGDPYITGSTTSTNLPLPDNAFQPQLGGGVDVFGAELLPDLSAVEFATYLGGPGDDDVFGATVDPFHNVWIGGRTSGGFPTTPNGPNPDFLGGPTDGFLARIPVPNGFNQGQGPGLPGSRDPMITYTGDGNVNTVLDVEVVFKDGRLIVIISGSNFSETPSPVEGCGEELRMGTTGEINVFDPVTGTFFLGDDTNADKGENCLPGGDILDLASDPLFPLDFFGGGLFSTSDGTPDGFVIHIDLGNLFAAGGGADLEFKKRNIFNREKSIPNALQVFKLIVRNRGPDTASNVRVTDSLPPGFTVEKIDTFSANGSECSQAGGEITCNLGAMPPDTAKAVSIRGRAPGDPGDYLNSAIATADNLIGPTRVASSELKVRPFAPLVLKKTVVSSDSSRIEYRIEIKNISEDEDATNVKMDDTLPPELFGVQFDTSRGKCNLKQASPFVATAQSTLNCTLGVLPAGDTWVIRIEGRPKDLRMRFSNKATVTADQVAYDSDYATIEKTDGAAAADLQLSLWFYREGNPAAVAMCRSMGASIFNAGPDNAAGVRVDIDQISAASLRTIDPRCSASGFRLDCNVGGIPPSKERKLSFLVCAEDEPENARFRGVVTSATPDPDPTNDIDTAAAELDPSRQRVRISPGGILSSSGFHRPLLLSPGSDPSLFGEGLADEIIVADTVPLPRELGGVSVELNGIPAPLIFVSPNQINFQTPWELLADTKASVVVRNNEEESLPAKVLIAPYNPGIFTANQTGSGQAAVLIAGTASVAAPEGSIPGARPVQVGEFISIFATGLGAVDSRPATGAASTATPLARTKTMPVVTIGGVEAPVSFSGLAPGFVGLYQVNAEVAEGTPAGDAADLRLTMGEVPSNEVTIAVAP